MRLQIIDEFEQLTRQDFIIRLKEINKFTCTDQHVNSDAQIEKLKNFERNVHLTMWHDTATVGGHN